mmetsp:Transcript_14373/g.38153  ORF Transcript_14373/g.38153 Transcript_14373/m.38153 type:complete len:220 (+) Transcript_14373:839-1498(+)
MLAVVSELSTISRKPISSPVATQAYGERRRSRPSLSHVRSMMRMIWRVRASCLRSSPHLNMTYKSLPHGSALMKTSQSGTFLEDMHLHLSTRRPQHSKRGSSGSWNLGGKVTLASSARSSGTRCDFGRVLTSSAAEMSCCSTWHCSATCARLGPQQRRYSSRRRPNLSETSGRCISAFRHQKNWWATWWGHSRARRRRKRARAESWRDSYLSTCTSCST